MLLQKQTYMKPLNFMFIHCMFFGLYLNMGVSWSGVFEALSPQIKYLKSKKKSTEYKPVLLIFQKLWA